MSDLPIQNVYAAYRMARSLLAMNIGPTQRQNEKNNAVERVLMSLYISAVSNGTDDIRGINHPLTRDTDFVEQLYVELTSKRIGKYVFAAIISTIYSLTNTPPPLAEVTATYRDGVITIRSLSTEAVIETIRPTLGARVIHILAKYPPSATAQMILRYESMARGGQHWSIPLRQYRYLYDSWGVRWEAFASPLNSGLIDRPDTSYCSLFSHDKQFGSVGDFFLYPLYGKNAGLDAAAELYLEADALSDDDLAEHVSRLAIQAASDPAPALAAAPPMHWAINPPFITAIIDRVVKKIEMELPYAERSDITVMLFIVLPSWTDLPSYAALMNSPYKRFHLHLGGGQHYYDHASAAKVVKSKSTVFVLDTCTPRRDYAQIARHMVC